MVDLSHILTNLNKLDAGVDEKIMLTSRDEQSCLVVSYREVSARFVTLTESVRCRYNGQDGKKS